MTDATLIQRAMRHGGVSQGDLAVDVLYCSRRTVVRVLHEDGRLKDWQRDRLRAYLATPRPEARRGR